MKLIYIISKKKWIEQFKDFFNFKTIYKIIDKNFTNYIFMNQIKVERIPDEFLKVKAKDEKTLKEIIQYKENEEYLVKLNNGNISISYYLFKSYIIEESLKNSLCIGNKNWNFKKGKAGIIYGNTLYVIIDEKTLEVFIFDESSYTFDPVCIFLPT